MDWLIVKTFLTMILIVGMMFVVLIFVRKYFYAKPQFVDENLRIVTSISLQPKKSIYLVKVFDKVMLVGVSDNAIASLGEVTDPETLRRIDDSGSKRRVKGFAEVLNSIIPSGRGLVRK